MEYHTSYVDDIREIKEENPFESMMSRFDRAAQLLWHHHAFLLAYASLRVPEITETLVNVDNAQKWGFAHEMGPFEIWDAIGVRDTVPRMEADGYQVAPWVHAMLEHHGVLRLGTCKCEQLAHGRAAIQRRLGDDWQGFA